MPDARTHPEVPAPPAPDRACLGPDGSAARVEQALALLGGRWKLAILFRLFGRSPMRFLALLRDIEGISHKVLTQQLRALAADGLVERTDFAEQPRRVEYRLSADGRALRPVLIGLRDFAAERDQTGSRPDA